MNKNGTVIQLHLLPVEMKVKQMSRSINKVTKYNAQSTQYIKSITNNMIDEYKHNKIRKKIMKYETQNNME